MELQRISSKEASSDIVVLPTGSTEQHGPHLPLGTDALIANGIAALVGDELGADVAPVLPYGLSEHHMDFRGTVTVSPVTYVGLIKDILDCLARHGYKTIVIVNGHGGNIGGLTTAVQEFHRTNSARVFLFNWWALKGVEFPDTMTDFHAGDAETSVAMALGIEQRGEPVDEMRHVPSGYRIRSMKEVTESGVMGYPTKASEKKGKIILDLVIGHIVRAVRGQ
jgi:creatinine amidohydrolase